MTYLRFWGVACDEEDCDEFHEAGATSQRMARTWAMQDGWKYANGLMFCSTHNN